MDDFDDELLGLAEGSTKRSKGSKSRSKSAPKRKRPAAEDSASDMDMSASDSDTAPPARKSRRDSYDQGEADDDDDDEEEENTMYPLEGKYKDEADRYNILNMTELEREGILGDRAEELSKLQEKREVRRMVKAKARADGGEEATRGSARERKATGTTSEKRATLETLKKKREEKGKKKERRDNGDDEYGAPSSPQARNRRDDVYTDDDASDDEPTSRSKKASKEIDVVGPSQLQDITIPRSRLAKLCEAPWFMDWIKGAWVRMSLGEVEGQMQYRLCEVTDAKEFEGSPYKVDSSYNVTTTIQLELTHADASRFFAMDGVSNSPATVREFSRLCSTMAVTKCTMPTAKEAAKIKTRLDSRQDYTLTEADLAARLLKKGSSLNATQSKAKLHVRLSHARSMNDTEQIEFLEAELKKFEPKNSPGKESEADRMRRVNERNRATNREEIKRAEVRGHEERKKQAEALARGDASIKVDPSARVKTMTRLKYDRDTPSRPGTPVIGSPKSGLITPPVELAAPLPKPKATKFSEVAKAVELDLDLDF